VNPFFNSKERIDLLFSVVDSWRKTPFISHTQLKNVGCDCVTFAHAVYMEIGLLPAMVDWPRYPLRSGGELFFQKICDIMEEHASSVEENQVGDLLVFSTGRSIHHVGIALSKTKFVHCVDGYGVIDSMVKDSTFSTRLKRVYRFSEKTS
jgi:cell wall-associated NlpC family hydrolase